MSKIKRNVLSSVSVAALGLTIFAVASSGQIGTSSRKSTLMMGLIHRWQFDGNVDDSAGRLSTTAIGPVAYTAVGNGQGIVLNGTTTGINLPPEKDMQFQESFSISVWANLFSRPSSGQMWSSIIFDGDDRPGLDPYALQASPDGKMHFLVTGVQDNLEQVAVPFPLNTFVFFTATYDKATGTQDLYEDGKLVGQILGNKNGTPVCTLVDHEYAGIGIGTNNGFPNSRYHYGWKGIISDLRIYNRAITPSEVDELYHLGVTTTKTRINPVINP